MKLLHIDSSVLGDYSVSRQLTAQVVERWKASVPGLEVQYRDLGRDPVPHLSGASLTTPPEARSPELQRDVALGDELIEEFLAADVVVIGAPMYNFGVPSQLKAWIDRIAVKGKTFQYTEKGPEGLAGGKKVIVLSARGGFYTEAPLSAIDHQESYLSAVFGFLGVSDLEFVRAEGIGIGPEQKQKSIDLALRTIDDAPYARAA